MYKYEVYLDGELITESNYEYDSESEADSEGWFAVDTYADCMDRNWSEFTVKVEGN